MAKKLVQHVLDQETRTRVISNEVIRTYNAVDNRVKDHASGLQMTWDEVVEKPDLGPMIEARQHARLAIHITSGEESQEIESKMGSGSQTRKSIR